MNTVLKKAYEAPVTTMAQVQSEASFCTDSKVMSVKANVEVDEWVTIDNDITFE